MRVLLARTSPRNVSHLLWIKFIGHELQTFQMVNLRFGTFDLYYCRIPSLYYSFPEIS